MTRRVVLSAPSVDRGSNQSSLFELRPDRVKSCDFTLRRLVENSEIQPSGPMNVSNSCKIQVIQCYHLCLCDLVAIHFWLAGLDPKITNPRVG